MINKENIYKESETDDIHRLLSGLKRVEAPKDFDFHVRARIAKGRPVEKRFSWIPQVVRYGVPLALVLTVGGYFGMRSFNTPADNGVAAFQQIETPKTQPAPQVQTIQPSGETVAAPQPEIASAETPEKIKPIVKTTPSTNPKTERPGGGSYDTAAGSGANIISKKDEDDLAPEPQGRRVLISTAEFLTNVGISASYAGAGGRIQSVGGTAAAAGIVAGDVIAAVNVQSGTIRVSRDGRSLTFRVK